MHCRLWILIKSPIVLRQILYCIEIHSVAGSVTFTILVHLLCTELVLGHLIKYLKAHAALELLNGSNAAFVK